MQEENPSETLKQMEWWFYKKTRIFIFGKFFLKYQCYKVIKI